jgi:hypothetical protein
MPGWSEGSGSSGSERSPSDVTWPAVGLRSTVVKQMLYSCTNSQFIYIYILHGCFKIQKVAPKEKGHFYNDLKSELCFTFLTQIIFFNENFFGVHISTLLLL